MVDAPGTHSLIDVTPGAKVELLTATAVPSATAGAQGAVQTATARAQILAIMQGNITTNGAAAGESVTASISANYSDGTSSSNISPGTSGPAQTSLSANQVLKIQQDGLKIDSVSFAVSSGTAASTASCDLSLLVLVA